MMGTFTKSFGSAGGYIAGSKKLIDYLKVNSQASCYSTSVSPPVGMQTVAAMKQIMNKECAGLSRIQRLQDNSRYFR
jgi:serine palmitoyltransferase